LNELDLDGGYTLLAPTEHTIMPPLSADIPLRWPISVDITIKVGNIKMTNIN
jgi:hypothetical protein